MTTKDLRKELMKELIKFTDDKHCSSICKLKKLKLFNNNEYRYICLMSEDIIELRRDGIISIYRCQTCKDLFKEENVK